MPGGPYKLSLVTLLAQLSVCPTSFLNRCEEVVTACFAGYIQMEVKLFSFKIKLYLISDS